MTTNLTLKIWAIQNNIKYNMAYTLFKNGKIKGSFQDINSKLIFCKHHNDDYIYSRFKNTLYYRDFFSQKDLSYYLLGAFITDGNVFNTTCRLSSKDNDWLEQLSSKIGINIPVHKIANKNHYYMSLYGKEITKWFQSHNCVENKTLKVIFPPIQENINDFIRGVIDGDGSIILHKNIKYSKVLIASASEIFLSQIQHHLKNIGIVSHINTRKPIKPYLLYGKIIKTKNTLYTLSIYGLNCFKLLNWCYYPNHELSLDRKNNLAQKIINYYYLLPILDNRKISKLDKNCKIDWPSNESLLNDIKTLGITKTASKLNISPKAIQNRLANRKIQKFEYQKKPRIRWPKNEELIILLKKHDKYSIICDILHVSRIQLRRYLKKVNLYKQYKNY